MRYGANNAIYCGILPQSVGQEFDAGEMRFMWMNINDLETKSAYL